MRIEVTRPGDNSLSRKLWHFEVAGDTCTLVFYATQSRQTNRRGWHGLFWSRNDERSHHSKLPRPESIPGDVLQDALRQYAMQARKVYIAWTAESNLYRTASLDGVPD